MLTLSIANTLIIALGEESAELSFLELSAVIPLIHKAISNYRAKKDSEFHKQFQFSSFLMGNGNCN